MILQNDDFFFRIKVRVIPVNCKFHLRHDISVQFSKPATLPVFSCIDMNKNSAKKYYMSTKKSKVRLLVRKVSFFYLDVMNMGEKWSEFLSNI